MTTVKKPKPQKRRTVWYVTTVIECMVCGRESRYRTAAYTKPAQPYRYDQQHCGCMNRELH